MNNSTDAKKLAFIALLISSIIWGATAPIMKWTLIITPVFLLAFLRFFFASFLILLFRPKLSLEKKDILPVIIASILGVSINVPFFFFGVSLSSAINAGVIGSSVPIFTLVASYFVLKEKIGNNMILGGIIGFAGIIVIMFEPLFKEGVSSGMIGNILLFLATFSWVGFEMISKKLFKKYNPTTITFYSFMIGWITFLPFAAGDFFSVLPKIISDKQFIFGVLFGIIFASTIAYSFWQWGLSKFDAAKVGFFLYLNPIVATTVAIFLLGEIITPAFIIGSILIFLGLYIAEKRHPFSVFHQEQIRTVEVVV